MSYFHQFVDVTRAHAAKARLREAQHQPREQWPCVVVRQADESEVSFVDAWWQLDGRDLVVLYLHDGSEARRFPDGHWLRASELAPRTHTVMTTVYASPVTVINDTRTA